MSLEYKLSFTASEINDKLGKVDEIDGILSQKADASSIPTKISQLENDANYLIEYTETDPTVPDWAKADTKPSYTADEVGADPTGTAVNIVGEHNTDAVAHNDIRLLMDDLTTRLNALADSDDDTLDQLSEIVDYIKNNKSLIDGITTNKISVSDIIDNLTTNTNNKPLSAAQGVALKSLIDAIVVPTKVSQLTNDEGYLTSYTETDPTVPDWAKADTKPSYTADEVGAYSLVRGVAIVDNDDLDTYMTPGSFTCQTTSTANTVKNSPVTTTGFSLQVEMVSGSSNPYLHQTLRANNATADVWKRSYRHGNGWGQWSKFATTDDVPDLSNSVPNTRKINGKALSSDITLSASDVGAAASSHGTHVTYSTTTPKAAGTAAVGSAANVARGDHVHPAQTTVSGNAGTATKLATARTIRTNLASTSTASFDGSANVTPGVTGTLPIANGGTGATTASAALTALGAAAASHGTHVTFTTTTPKAAGTAAVGSATTVSRSDHVHPAQTTVSGNAGSATKLATARTIRTNLASTSTASFNGTANVTPGVTGVLPVANGGTGVTSLDDLASAIGSNGSLEEGWTLVTSVAVSKTLAIKSTTSTSYYTQLFGTGSDASWAWNAARVKFHVTGTLSTKNVQTTPSFTMLIGESTGSTSGNLANVFSNVKLKEAGTTSTSYSIDRMTVDYVADDEYNYDPTILTTGSLSCRFDRCGVSSDMWSCKVDNNGKLAADQNIVIVVSGSTGASATFDGTVSMYVKYR